MSRASPGKETRAVGAPFAGPVGQALLSFVVAVLPVFLVGAVGVQIKADLGLNAAGLGVAVAAFWTAGVVASSSLGGLAERFGALAALRAGGLLNAAGLLAIALFARSLRDLILLLVVCGMGNALIQPAVALFLTGALPPSRQGRAFGFTLAAIPTATLLSGTAVPVLALTVGWRWAFVGAALLAASSVATLQLVAAPVVRVPSVVRRRRGRGGVPLRLLVLLAVASALGAAATGSLGAFLVAGATEVGVGEAAAGWLFALASVAALAVRVGLGILVDRRGGRLLGWAASMLLAGSVCIAGLALQVRGVYILAAVGAFALAWGWPGLFNLAIVWIVPSEPAYATGIAMTGTYLGGVIGPPAFGLLVEHQSYAWAWSAAAGWAVAAGAVMAVAMGLAPGSRRVRDA